MTYKDGNRVKLELFREQGVPDMQKEACVPPLPPPRPQL